MIVTRTPFRVTLGGGGTDLESYYSKHGGFIFAMAITQYMYVMVNRRRIDRKVILHYSRSEEVDHIDQLQHELAREGLRHQNIADRIEISSVADLPSGTGLGSSSCYLVGLLMALHHYRRDYVSLARIAETACDIEMRILNKTVGKQDQYMAAFGGMTRLDIAPNGAVAVAPVHMSHSAMAELAANTHLYYTGHRRDALEVLKDQNNAMLTAKTPAHATVADSLTQIKELGYRIHDAIISEDFDAWGRMLHEHWENKKRLSPKVSLTRVDALYDHVRENYGVLGGKISGAGGGGFLMLYCPGRHKRLEAFMAEQGMPRLHYMVEPEGAKVVTSLASGDLSPAVYTTPQRER